MSQFLNITIIKIQLIILFLFCYYPCSWVYLHQFYLNGRDITQWCITVFLFPTLYSMRLHAGRLEIDHVVVVFIPQKRKCDKSGLDLLFCLVLKSDGENDNNVGWIQKYVMSVAITLWLAHKNWGNILPGLKKGLKHYCLIQRRSCSRHDWWVSEVPNYVFLVFLSSYSLM